MKRIFIYIVLLSLFFGCSPQYRLNSLLRKHPELITRPDTIVLRDTIYTPAETPLDTTVDLIPIINPPTLNDSTNIAASPPSMSLPFDGGRLLLQRDINSALVRIKLMLDGDTIPISSNVTIPHVTATIKEREPTFTEQFFYFSGVIAWLISALTVLIKAFIKLFKSIINGKKV